MAPVVWLFIVVVGLWLVSKVDRMVRDHRIEHARTRRRWLEYAEMAAHNAERWRTRI